MAIPSALRRNKLIKTARIYRVPVDWKFTSAQLEESLKAHSFQPVSGMDLQSQGWAPVRENGGLVHSIAGQFLLRLSTEKKLLPSSVVKEFVRAKAIEVEEQQGFKPGRKQLKELKEQVTDDLLPRAFSIKSSTLVWIDPINGWLVVDSGSAAIADDVIKSLIKAIDKFPLETFSVQQSPVSAMTSWLAQDICPAGFTVDQDTEFRSNAEGKATVRYLRQSLEAEDIKRHITSGKQCTRLAMTWADRISFVLNEDLVIKRISPLDVMKESGDGTSKNDDERFDSDVTLMTGELNKMFSDLVVALGGFPIQEIKQAA